MIVIIVPLLLDPIITPLSVDGPGAASNPVVALPTRVWYTSRLASRGEEDT